MTTPPDPLVDVVLTLADEDGSTPDEVKYLVLAALDGDAALADAADGRYDCPEPAPAGKGSSTEPVGAFLQSITVSGFRGVGPERTLTLHPAPGLTVVAGRNGSGKSTFAEALEVGLTRKSYRWAERAADWQNAWGNLHVRGPRHIRIRIGEQDVGTTTVGIDWAPGVERFDDLTSWVQRPGAKREDGLGSLGWGTAIGLYRPILSYEEVSGLLTAEPKKLYDALCAILGLDQLVTAQQRLDTLKKTTSAPVDDARTGATAVKKALAESTDERAIEALRLLRKHSRDLDALRALATGSRATSAGALGSLRNLADLELPDRATVDRAAGDLRAAVGDLALFLPRATRPGSPFRFVVLDDPIQAMDPSKIDGLVSVLAEHARTRQVVVFSHDDRLPEAVRRLVPDARIVEVTRAAGSVIEIGDTQDPARRDVDDARAFVRDPAVPDELVRRVVPRLCRSAVETAARDAWYARAFAGGADRQVVESTWSDARNQPQRIALALHGDRERSTDGWLRAVAYWSTALGVCGSANHDTLRSDPKYAVECVGRLVDDLRATIR
ncbi:AAA family ATPase [Pseudonocardia endophytica]|uniref:Nuclease SbcCD subunit C n=1 Tax=Pseudonocardia endophytica TaxID=401976 RepID=A0A4R1HQ07_PSEEN|nr:AAA family ATPase [Pseudonocardia endophytica]TCK22775.1 AAA domain-containing protein [Pseudonocardia endophytica]